jgi:hypothetical protein
MTARLAAEVFPVGTATLGVEDAWMPPPQPLLPGPGWFTDDVHGAAAGYGVPPGADEWPTAYPFKYYPQGHVPSDTPDQVSCLLSPEPSNSCFCTTPPTYFGTFFFDAIALDRRSNLEASPLILDSNNVPVFSTADFNFQTEAGLRAGLILASPCGNDWIGEYFGIQNYEDTVTIADAAGVTDVFFGTGAGAPSLTAEYESSLDSLELTVRTRQTRRLAPLAGIRYIQVAENFNSLTDPITRQGRFSRTDNDLFGFQFGVQGLICERGPIRIEATVKGGPYYNDVDVDVQQIPGGQAAVVVRSVQHWHTAFVGHGRIGLVWRLGRRVNFRVGYELLWIDGIALGPNQNNNILYSTNLESVDLSSVVYQGGNLGFDLSW